MSSETKQTRVDFVGWGAGGRQLSSEIGIETQCFSSMLVERGNLFYLVLFGCAVGKVF